MLSSLRTRILLVTLAIITLALVINAAVSYTILKSHNDRQVAQNLISLSQGNALAIEEWVTARIAMVESARFHVIGGDPTASLVQLADSGGFSSANLGLPDGGLIASDGWIPDADYDAREREWYQSAVAQEGTIISQPYRDAESGDLVVTIATPVRQNGRLYGVVGGSATINQLVDQVNSINPTPASFAFLSSNDETIIAHPDTALSLEPLERISSALTPTTLNRLSSNPTAWENITVGDEIKRLAVTPIAGTNWDLGVALDEYEATAGLRAIIKSALITLLIVIAVTVIAIGIWLKRTLSGLERARDALNDIASGDGDLTRRLAVAGKDEVAQISDAFNRFVDKMEHVLIDVRASSDAVHHAANEIASGGQDLSRRTDNTAASLQQTSASIEEITSTVQHTASSAQEASQLSRNASDVAGHGGEVMGNVVSTMEEITQASEKIGEIVNLMNSISFQTNLLALNASVEAARAGEHGRGFAVVAEEVRNLARRSSDAANDIQTLIEDSQGKVNSGTALVQSAGNTMSDIVSHITRVTDVLQEIEAATSEQSEGIKQVNVAVADLDRMTQENAALVEESTTAAEQLKEQSGQLATVIGRFKVSSQGAPAQTPALAKAAQPRPMAPTPRLATTQSTQGDWDEF
ncbi:methyl-accepting chemotaxis protein [Halomonas sp. HMF6819]|uniref:methyl-accepting chemotaxis protein n=1 Tax=Halomonas sp. HMF6819 TaxID=3373085 RepID=UPI0037A5E04A